MYGPTTITCAKKNKPRNPASELSVILQPENNAQVAIGKENYFLSADGLLCRQEGSAAAFI